MFRQIWKSKLLMTMRILFLLFTLCMSQGYAVNAYSQSAKINLNITNSSIKNVLEEIEEQTELHFAYDASIIDVNREVSITSEGKLVPEILDEIFSRANVVYAIVDQRVLLTKSEDDNNSQQPQTKTISGKVTDASGDPFIGVTIVVKGTTIGTVTNFDGEYNLSGIPENATLVFSFIGMKSQEFGVGTQSKIDVTLEEDAIGLDEVVAIGYGTKKKESLTSAISVINSEDITNTKQANVVSSLQGKVPGLLIRQESGKPGNFDTDLSVRGYGEDPLIVIDGIVRGNDARTLGELNSDDIESISVLKDASASIYGMGTGNGVVLVTTKKGVVGKPTISYSNNFAFGVPTAMPEPVDIVTYMNLRNEMALNSKQQLKYSDEFIQHYIDGDEGYVDTDWYDLAMKNFSLTQNHNLSFRGGNEQTQYYLSGSFTDEPGLFDSSIYKYDRYTINANLTTKMTDDITVNFRSSLNSSYQSRPQGNSDWNMFYYLALAERTVGPTTITNSDHYSWVEPEGRNPQALIDPDNGYQKDYRKAFNNNLDVKYEAPFLKGLDLNVSAAYDYNSSTGTDFAYRYPLYNYWTDVQVGQNADITSYSEDWNTSTRFYLKAQANYSLTLGNHHVNALLAAEMTKNNYRSIGASREYGDFYTHDIINQGDESTASNSGTRSESATAGYISRIDYDYAGKYLLELMGRYDGTYYYASGKRWAFFPSYSIGWRMSEESFIKDNFGWIDNLKVRASDGKTGSLQGGAYAYIGGYSQGDGYVFDDASQVSGYYNHSVTNTILSWADVRMRNIGVDWGLFEGLFGGSVDFFKRETIGTAATRSSTVPDFYGVDLPSENLNRSENVGVELMLTHRNTIGKFNYKVAASATFARSRDTYIEAENTATYTSSYDYWDNGTLNRWNNARSGATYLWEGGQFQNLNDINSSSVMYDSFNSNTNLVPGMYKIADLNGNGIIDEQDRQYTWSETNPPLQFGLNISGDYKNFDFSLVFTGAALVHKSVSLSGAWGYGYFNNTFTTYLDRWHLADGYTNPQDPNAQWVSGYWPALTTASSGYDTSRNATYNVNQPYNYVDATYVRLKSAEIGYTLSKEVLNKIGITNARFFASGTNLVTICNSLLKPYDPERNDSSWMGAGGYPLMKTFSIGVNLSL